MDGVWDNNEELDVKWEAFRAEGVRNAEMVLREFGEELVKITEQVFATQAEASRKKPWDQKKNQSKKNAEIEGGSKGND